MGKYSFMKNSTLDQATLQLEFSQADTNMTCSLPTARQLHRRASSLMGMVCSVPACPSSSHPTSQMQHFAP
eukprot:1148016-Rhodomonas_salina.2